MKNWITSSLLVSKNVRNPKGRVLISYIVHPYLPLVKKDSHTNIQEVLNLVDALNKEGLSVDLVDYRYKRKINYKPYQYIFGFGNALEASFYSGDFRGRRICLATGSRFDFQTNESLMRLKACADRYGDLLASEARFVDNIWPMQWSFADELLVTGNELVKNTYAKTFFGTTLRTIPVTYIDTINGLDVAKKRDASLGVNNVLWFGGSGYIHKGLDLTIEACSNLPDVHLHICGVSYSKQFQSIFSTHGLPNKITNYGFVGVHSTVFKSIMRKCGFVILPSCSEGQASSVIQVMASGGLLPVVSDQCGLLPEHPSVRVENLTVEGVKLAINAARLVEPPKLKELWIDSALQSRKINSIDSYVSKVMSSF